MTDDEAAYDDVRYVAWDRILGGVILCRDCGSLVTDTQAHDRFHDSIQSAARAASRAASRTERIG